MEIPIAAIGYSDDMRGEPCKTITQLGRDTITARATVLGQCPFTGFIFTTHPRLRHGQMPYPPAEVLLFA